MCIDAPESTTYSLSSGSRVDAGKHLFSEERRMLLFHAILLLTHFWPTSTLLRGHLALATLFPLENDPQILERWATLMRFTWAKKSERRIFVSNFTVTRNSLCEFHTSDWFPHHSIWTFLSAVHQPDDAHMNSFRQTDNNSVS